MKVKENNLTGITENIISLKSLFYRAIGKNIISKTTLPPMVFQAVISLKRKGPLSMSEIGRHLQIPKPNVTIIIDRLIEEKLAERLHDQDDRRVIKIKLTKEGYQYIEKYKKIFREHINKRLETLTRKELYTFTESLNNVREILTRISNNDENK